MKNSLRLSHSFLIVWLLFSCGQEKTSSTSSPKVPDGFSVEVAAGPDLVDFPMFSTLDETGRLFVFESIGNVYEKTKDALDQPQFRIKLLEDTNGDRKYDKSTIFADKVGFPQGGVFYKGSLYASSAPDLLKLTDTNGDGVADKREVLLSGWILNVNANSLIGPFMGPDGWLYMTNAIMGFDVTTKEGVHLKGETARIWRVRTDGSGLEWISAGGMNNPVELTFTEAGEVIGTETYFTDPRAGERDALVYWTEGGVYPKPNNNIDHDKLIRTGDLMPVISKFSRVAPSGIGRYRSTALGDDFKDNLFSAQFNTHRIMRHIVSRDGASFKTKDEVFFSVQNEDFHPTDVLEDADGSLLIVETGGWFIKGCPLSQVSKPELEGSIYRVRKNGAKKVDDPYGNQIDWKATNSDDASQYLGDSRVFVTDRAQQALVDMGNTALLPLKTYWTKAADAAVRTRIIFVLYRIGTPEAIEQMKVLGLTDASVDVKIAAIRSLGLLHDKSAIPALIEVLSRDESLAVQRQAATALGQINDKQAVPSLLLAAKTSLDRFTRHSIIYALIQLKDDAVVKLAMKDSTANLQDACLIALDQMNSPLLKTSDVTGFLTGSRPVLRNTALWVASHHPGWSPELIGFMKNRFVKGPLTEEEKDLYGKLLEAFCEKQDIQQFMATSVGQASTGYKLFFLDVMGKSNLKELPVSWTKPVTQLLLSGDVRVKAAALKLVSLRGVKSWTENVMQMADDKNNPTELRINAIAILMKAQPELSLSHYDYLYQTIRLEKDLSLRQRAAYALTQSKLSEQQLARLTDEYLLEADPFILPRLVPLYEGAHSAAIGKALAATLLKSTALDGFSVEGLEKTFEKYPAEVKPEVEKLMNKLKEVHGDRLKRLQAFEAQIVNGSLDNGRQIFLTKATCATCHTVGSDGGHFGPDLTSIQRDRSAHDLLEAIVYPSASFVREYETFLIKTKTTEYRGIIKEKNADATRVDVAPGNSVLIPAKDIVSVEVDNVSMMPQGLDKILTEQEMADLMAFLMAQDQDPETDSKILRH